MTKRNDRLKNQDLPISYRITEEGVDDAVVKRMAADCKWQRSMRIWFIVLLAVAIAAVSIWDGSLYRAAIRGIILLVTTLIVYLKPKAVFDLSILVHRSGRIVVRRGLMRRAVANGPDGALQMAKTKRNWLIGANRVKVPVRAFPNLDNQIRELLA